MTGTHIPYNADDHTDLHDNCSVPTSWLQKNHSNRLSWLDIKWTELSQTHAKNPFSSITCLLQPQRVCLCWSTPVLSSYLEQCRDECKTLPKLSFKENAVRDKFAMVTTKSELCWSVPFKWGQRITENMRNNIFRSTCEQSMQVGWEYGSIWQ